MATRDVAESPAKGRVALSKKLRFEVFKRDSFKCQYCGASAPEVLLHVDHIKSVADGGTNDIWNLVTACQPCNAGKSDRALSDQATVVKAKNQLDQLQERREQLEMLMDWQSGLVNIQECSVDACAELFAQITKDYTLNASGRDSIGRLVAKFSTEAVVDAMRSIAPRYLQTDPESGRYTQASVDVWIQKVGSVCGARKFAGQDENISKLYYARGIVRKRMQDAKSWYDGGVAFDVIEAAYLAGCPMHRIMDSAKSVGYWNDFLNIFQSLAGRKW